MKESEMKERGKRKRKRERERQNDWSGTEKENNMEKREER